MRKLVAGIAFAALVTVGGVSFAQDQEELGANPTPGQCYTPCAQQYSNATDRIRCIAQCCGC
ncbi:MAG: hypothetical protein PSV23_05095 [Brevundimonas sp.]|uniref:hypothetical protein n=1 Tax=Brevundimonas sp. TaxID=1871086 RepID=UPI002488F3D4|nr:hypothetical protein [Brevundimonas sp.]MDI1326159.1 hypothetical protein [Brevundimonas sp.]